MIFFQCISYSILEVYESSLQATIYFLKMCVQEWYKIEVYWCSQNRKFSNFPSLTHFKIQWIFGGQIWKLRDNIVAAYCCTFLSFQFLRMSTHVKQQ